MICVCSFLNSRIIQNLTVDIGDVPPPARGYPTFGRVGAPEYLPSDFCNETYIRPRSLLRDSIQAPTGPALAPSLENFMVVSLLTRLSECF